MRACFGRASVVASVVLRTFRVLYRCSLHRHVPRYCPSGAVIFQRASVVAGSPRSRLGRSSVVPRSCLGRASVVRQASVVPRSCLGRASIVPRSCLGPASVVPRWCLCRAVFPGRGFGRVSILPRSCFGCASVVPLSRFARSLCPYLHRIGLAWIVTQFCCDQWLIVSCGRLVTTFLCHQLNLP